MAVGLVRSYLELCGYFVLTEIPVRVPEGDHGYRDLTDIDILAVRFPHRPLDAPKRITRPLEVFLAADPLLATFEAGVDVIVGEVKAGQAEINAGLRRIEALAFALRRVGCCPESEILDHARTIAHDGQRDLSMSDGMPCRVRVVSFAGHGTADQRGVRTVPLRHIDAFIRRRLGDGGDVLTGVLFKDSVLALIALEEKLERRSDL